MTPNVFTIAGDTATTTITRVTGGVYEVIVDTEELPKIQNYRWYINVPSKGYCRVMSTTKVGEYSTPVYIHHIIMGSSAGFVVDHINGNPLDNRKINLRVVPLCVNQQNRKGAQTNSRSGIRGVSWDRSRCKWAAYCSAGGSRYFVGRFNSIEEADFAVREARSKHLPFSLEAL